MTVNDPYSNTLTKQTIPPALRTTTVTGSTVDRAAAGAMYQAATVVVTTGTITDGTHTIEVQDSPDDSVWTPVADANLQGAEAAIVAADDNKIFEIGYLGRQRYLRVVITAAGTTTGGIVGANIVLSDPRVKPAVHS